MKWLWWKREAHPDPDELFGATLDARLSSLDATTAKQEADREFVRIRAQRPLVDRVTDRIAHEMKVNHFGQDILASMLPRRHT